MDSGYSTMTIEINRAGSVYIYRINPHNLRLIDRRKNVHRGRWEPYWYYPSAEDAADALWDIEHDDETEHVDGSV